MTMKSSGWTLVQLDCVLIRWGNWDTEAHTLIMSRGDEGRDQGDVSIGQGPPKTTSQPREAGGEKQVFLPGLRGNQTSPPLSLRLLASRAAGQCVSIV